MSWRTLKLWQLLRDQTLQTGMLLLLVTAYGVLLMKRSVYIHHPKPDVSPGEKLVTLHVASHYMSSAYILGTF